MPPVVPTRSTRWPRLMHPRMHLDKEPLYRKIMETDEGGHLYKLIPLMATASYGQIGALNAESYCERVLSCANDVLTKGMNTVLKDEELELLVILRMNRDFMKFIAQALQAPDQGPLWPHGHRPGRGVERAYR